MAASPSHNTCDRISGHGRDTAAAVGIAMLCVVCMMCDNPTTSKARPNTFDAVQSHELFINCNTHKEPHQREDVLASHKAIHHVTQ